MLPDLIIVTPVTFPFVIVADPVAVIPGLQVGLIAVVEKDNVGAVEYGPPPSAIITSWIEYKGVTAKITPLLTLDTYAAASLPPPLEKLIVMFKLLEGYPVPPLYNIMLASDPFDNDAVAIEPEPPPVKDAVKSWVVSIYEGLDIRFVSLEYVSFCVKNLVSKFLFLDIIP